MYSGDDNYANPCTSVDILVLTVGGSNRVRMVLAHSHHISAHLCK